MTDTLPAARPWRRRARLTLAAAAVALVAAEVPWSHVGPGWMLAVWSPATPHRPGEQCTGNGSKTGAARPRSPSTPPVAELRLGSASN
jgi:hypothetical protein